MCAANEWSKQTEWLPSTGKLPKCIYRLHSCPGFCLSALGWIQSTLFLKSHHKYSCKQQKWTQDHVYGQQTPWHWAAYSTKTLPSSYYFLSNFSAVCSSCPKTLSLEHDLQMYRVKEIWGNGGGKSQRPGCLESFWAWKQYLSLVRGGVWCQKKILFKDEWTWEGLNK